MFSKIFFFFVTASFTFPSWGENISRPIFTEDRIFVFQADQPARLVSAPVETFVMEDSIEACVLEMRKVEYDLARFFHFSESLTMSYLSQIYGKLNSSSFRDLRLIIDFFGTSARIFRGFFISSAQNKNNLSLISVDCSWKSRLSWSGLMGHELSHYFNQHRNLAPWVDEMIAQTVEVQDGYAFYERFSELRKKDLLPGFLSQSLIFHSSLDYSMNLFFGLWLKKNFGGWEILKALSSDTRDLSDVSRKLLSYTRDKEEFRWLSDAMTPRGLIRHFALAMNVNMPLLNGQSIFQVPMWNGFGPIAPVSGRRVLAPAGFLRVSGEMKLRTLPTDVEAHRVLKRAHEFRIQKVDEVVTGNWTENFLVVVNLSETEHALVEVGN